MIQFVSWFLRLELLNLTIIPKPDYTYIRTGYTKGVGNRLRMMNALRNSHLVRTSSQLLSRVRNRSSHTQKNDVCKMILEPLDQRQLVRVSGTEIVSFLQGLITNDMRILESPSVPSMFTLFLNKAGRVMYDALIYKTSDPLTVLIECDKDISSELTRHLKIYRVRRNIQIDDVNEELKLWVMFNSNDVASKGPKLENESSVQIVSDPRLRHLGFRLLAPANLTHKDLKVLCNDRENVVAESHSSACNYRDHRYALGVGEGIIDLQPGKQFPLESNCDLLNGVSFNKGCYIGQELTARVHHTGVIRKRHMPLLLNAPLSADSTKVVRKEDGTKIGTVLGCTEKRAIGLMRIEQALKCKNLFIDASQCHTEVPQWWPPELLGNVSRRETV